ncbi:hypothetical protein F946_03161 [Acinetobacter johnsonii ANC 3681]|uniref:Uncharacterized protein n=1 Tax=Acinetobacter johnsonii ANC 3681 TaxID=1217662 RepID=N9BCZ2_ACIJO|nr:hypothetical protein [Acinetobacter johnsonii]ENV71482.1 hypothetical protein F946_03161 [Acinetobacter johnsonii ANC 3681]
MLERFEAIECFSSSVLTSLPEKLILKDDPDVAIFYNLILIRLLTGNLDIYCNKEELNLEQRFNFYELPGSIQPLNQNLGGYFNITNQELADCISANVNRALYKELFFEFCSYFFAKQKGNNETAFIHIYRILERISYAFPLIWASKQNDYYGTFDKLKKFFEKKDAKELNAFKMFLSSFLGSTLLSVNSEINLFSVEDDWKALHYQSLISLIGEDNAESFLENERVTIKNNLVIDLIVNVRNKYFHALTGKDQSFTSEHLICPNEFFECINSVCISWLAFIVVEVIKTDLRV